MATVDADIRSPNEVPESNIDHTAVDALVEAVAGVTLEHANTEDTPNDKITTIPLRPFKVYSRSQLLYLYRSPLVKPPGGMPALKDWFGDWNEQQLGNKKDPESSSPSANTRDRRFRRDPEDGEASGRPSFRSTLSQPSQMGNFRHQSIRTNDRDKDKDTERERERDLRDKEGQERLRNLSDKYDRERLGISSSSSNLRHKERDSAPHLPSSAGRLGPAQASSATARRTDGRDAPKRKAVESSEDWRRGPEPSRARDDRSDNSRRDRDNRDRPRSRVRDLSRSRRDPSTTRRERDRDRDEKGRERDRVPDRRGDGDRDEHRRDKDDYPRRDRDDHLRRDWDDFHQRDREKDELYPRDSRDRHEYSRQPRDVDRERDLDEDPRRWRDDGKRDERVAARRDRDRPWDKHDDRDRERPTATDDRDARSRRGNGRDRRLGGVGEDGRDRDDRRERDREAEPAWMETYVPTSPGNGILGAKTSDGELDGIQAWKKGMKEKERKEKGTSSQDATKKAELETSTLATASATSGATETPLDEIQLFKLLMKREAEKDVEKPRNGLFGSPPARGASNTSGSSQEQSKAVSSMKDDTPVAAPRPTQADSILNMQQALEESSKNASTKANVVGDVERPLQSEKPTVTPLVNGSQTSLSSLISSTPGDSSLPSHLGKSSTPTLDIPQERSRVMSRVLSNPSSSAMSSATHSVDASPVDQSVVNSSASSTFNPPPGSRLLAFGSRLPVGPEVLAPKIHPSLDPVLGKFPPPGGPVLSSHRSGNLPSSTSANHPMSGMHQVAESMAGLGPDAQFSGLTPSDSSRVPRTYSPHRNPSQSFQFEDMHDTALGQLNDPLKRSSITSAVERAAFGLPAESGTPYTDLSGGPSGSNYPAGGSFDMNGGNIPGANYATSKGSRFAKFFDSKTRDGQPVVGMRKVPPGPGYTSTSPHPGQRQEALGLNGMMGKNSDTRTMEDIFAMLQSSAQQTHRLSPQIPQSGRIPSGGGSFVQNHPDLHALQQQQQQLHASQHFAQNNHLDSLYDSRIDDRNFVPDGMVPGLRPAPSRSRSREPSGVLFNEQLDDPLHFNVQRMPQQRNLEHMYSSSVPSAYSQQVGMMRNGGMPLQQAQFRGGPSPISNQASLQMPSQRLPPGLANLGGRPPHDPSQFLGGPVGGGVHGGLHGGSPAQAYNNYNGGGLGYGGNPQVRGPPGPQNPLVLNSMANMGLQNTMDLRAASQAQLLGMGGGALRGAGPGFGPQHVPPSQIPSSHMLMRQQQQQQHIPQHLLPPHLQQQQQGMGGANGQAAQDLMALLMGGHRD